MLPDILKYSLVFHHADFVVFSRGGFLLLPRKRGYKEYLRISQNIF